MIALAAVLGIALGFTLGLWTYSHLYQHFLVAVEAKCARREAILRAKATLDKAILDQTRARLVEQYGPDLSKHHQQIIDEELAQVVTRPRAGGNGDA